MKKDEVIKIVFLIWFILVLETTTVIEYTAKITYKDQKVLWTWTEPVVLIRSSSHNKKDVINGNGYVFSHLGKREFISVGDYLYNSSLVSKNLIEMVIEADNFPDFRFVSDGFNLLYIKGTNLVLSDYLTCTRERVVCGNLDEEVIGFDEAEFNVIVKEADGTYSKLFIYDSCSKKVIEPDSDLHKIALYLINPGNNHIESQWYNLRHIALFSPNSVDQLAAGHLMKFKVSPLKNDVQLCQDLSKYLRQLIAYLTVVQIVIHMWFVVAVILVFVIIYGNLKVFKVLKKKLLRAKRREKEADIDRRLAASTSTEDGYE
ncbi:unnamed protein product [Bursaphelenchus okinawaensis]|uniref:Uncharacterized protein n=1 Tax=Bursaphelenchus okinawaensis TaxID=465554 RepID=A0A811KX49_9BILA|nr:unnamed protein product [Bursaphelenchus okinawaensis]CAG9113247.1 unnamed protein product [Bursaphelenchus okinawaensis]